MVASGLVIVIIQLTPTPFASPLPGDFSERRKKLVANGSAALGPGPQAPPQAPGGPGQAPVDRLKPGPTPKPCGLPKRMSLVGASGARAGASPPGRQSGCFSSLKSLLVGGWRRGKSQLKAGTGYPPHPPPPPPPPHF